METIVLDIDGVQVEHQIDEHGNAVLDGVVKFTKEELNNLGGDPLDLTASTDPNIDEVTFDTIAQAAGITIMDNDGKPKSYDMTTEGFAAWSKDIHATAYKQGVDSALNDIFDKNPDLYDMYKYKQDRGTLEGYVVKPKLNELVINEATEEGALWEIVYTAEIAQGKNHDRAKKIADFSKANESLRDDAQDALDYLKKKEAKEMEAARIEADKRARELAAAEEQWYGVTYDNRGNEKVLNISGSMYDKVVTKGTVGDLLIPAAGIKVKTADGKEKQLTRKDIFDYMSKPVKEINGVLVTQAQLDEYNRMQNIDNVTKQFLLNLTGNDAAGVLLDRRVTQKVIKVIKANTQVPGGKPGTVAPVKGEPNPNRRIVLD